MINAFINLTESQSFLSEVIVSDKMNKADKIKAEIESQSLLSEVFISDAAL